MFIHAINETHKEAEFMAQFGECFIAPFICGREKVEGWKYFFSQKTPKFYT